MDVDNDALFASVYAELRQLARRRLRGGVTLSPTALVHETYLRLTGSSLPTIKNARHFVAIAAIAMRRILIERARAAQRLKREPPSAMTDPHGAVMPAAKLLELDAALGRLSQLDAEMARVVELRYFAGLTVEEAADVIGIAPRSVNRAWTAARAWLQRELG